MKPIVTVPNNVLVQPAKTVKVFDKKLESLIKEMEKTLKATYKPKGVGLAAPQVGISYRIFITKLSAKDEMRVFINPEIIGFSNEFLDEEKKEEEQKLEGCLSIPDIWGHVKRAASLTLRYQTITGEQKEELIEGFLSTVIQHETDHTNGILFTQRIMEQKAKLYRTEINSDGKEVLKEITI